jgi:hypothetical protein
MSQIQNTATPSVGLRRGFLQPQYVAAAVLSTAVITLVIVLAAIALRPSPAPPAAERAVNITDGWMTGTTPISRALHTSGATAATDGWAGRYLPSAQTVNVTDGWAGRYLH